jgi:NADPH:quinone reductase-like Zn-dependent oxidoreductase
MKAAQISEYGGPEVVQINDVAKPEVKPGQVLVEVHSANINPFDFKLRLGYMKDAIQLQFPFTLGGDVAGIVAEVGDGVEGLTVGDRVYGQAAGVAGSSGAFAEFAATQSGQLAQAPKGLSWEEVASLPLAGVSAWQALGEHLELKPGQQVLIHGGAGGIGSLAVQIAKSLGAHVTATSSASNSGYVKGLGADEVMDYTSQDVSELRGFDAAFDTVGGAEFNKLLRTVKRGGKVVSMGGYALDKALAEELGVKAVAQGTRVTTAALNALRDLVESGAVKPQVGRVFELAQTREAFESLEGGSVRGKVVVRVR